MLLALPTPLHDPRPTAEKSALTLRELALVRIAEAISSQNPAEWAERVEDGVRSGLSREEIEEVIFHLSIYVGFPKALQSFQRMKALNIGYCGQEIPVSVPGQFNFFRQADVEAALFEVHPDFGQIAGTNAAALCARGGLSPAERALITLASDVVQDVFEGPFQIHVRMVLECGGSFEKMSEALNALDSDALGIRALKARKILLAAEATLECRQNSSL